MASFRFDTYMQRATAKTLLKHPFIRQAGSTAELEPLVRRYEAFKKTGKKSKPMGPDLATIDGGTVKTEWDFDETIRGTIKGMPVQLNLDALQVRSSCLFAPLTTPDSKCIEHNENRFNYQSRARLRTAPAESRRACRERWL